MIKIIISIALFFSMIVVETAYALPAFPGAEGMGASTVGGRGGTVYLVTNLNDSGPGSFRNAVEMPPRSYFNWESQDAYNTRLEAAGHRIIVFKVSGFIHLLSYININIPYLTIAGQTSPGGIALSGGSVKIRSHDIIMTHIRIRSGSDVCDPANLNNTNECDINGDALNIAGVDGTPVYNVIVDHCSMAWGNDETVEVGNWYADTYDITLSWNAIGEGLDDPAPENNHGYGLIAYGKFALTRPTAVTMHHNYISNFRMRLPEIGGNTIADVRNNVSYNWEGFAMHSENIPSQNHSKVNFVDNYTKPGPMTISNGTMSAEVAFCDYNDPVGKCHAQDAGAYQTLYVHGNLGNGRTSQNDPHWRVATGWTPVNWLSTSWQKTEPFTVPGIPVTTTEMSSAYADTILTNVGANKPVRDSLDARFVSEYYAGTGSTKPDMHWSNYPTGWPTFSTSTPPADTDNDGMANAWETTRGLNTSSNDSAGDDDNDGYTNIEEYLHFLAAGEVADPPPSYQCNDGNDNDSDGKADYPSDPGCSSSNDTDEADPITTPTYNLSSFTQLVTDWLKTISSPADVNSDGKVNSQDLGIMMSNWN